MKLVINYDFFNAILDVNEGYTPMKIVRNDKKVLAIFEASFFALNYGVTKRLPDSLFLLLLQTSSFFGGCYAYYKMNDYDLFKERSTRRLKELAIYLNKNDINTNYNLLLQSELLEKNYKFHLNKSVIPEIIENKYVLVPTYDFNNNIKNICIDQEHIIGTDKYVLSVGSPKKQLKLVYNNI